mgnify:CR=1 FL=1
MSLLLVLTMSSKLLIYADIITMNQRLHILVICRFTYRPEQCAEAVLTLMKDETMNGEAIICTPRQGNIVADKTREIECAKML